MKKGKLEVKTGDNKELNKETGRTGTSPTAGLRHMNWTCTYTSVQVTEQTVIGQISERKVVDRRKQ